MNNLSPYQTAHLIVAAIRVLEHRDGHPPSVEAMGQLLTASVEQVHRLCRKLEQQGIVEMTSGAFGIRVFISDHKAIEQLPDDSPKSGMGDELARFKQEQQGRNKTIEDLKQKEEARRKELFRQIEQQFKKKPSPDPEAPEDKTLS
jgi:DNA-binding transcriptional regulator YhcF (GntR family)